MNEAAATILLFAVAIIWFLLPWLPALIESRRRSGALPLSVDRRNEGEVRHFAQGFKAFLESNLWQPTLRDCIDRGISSAGRLNDGTPYSVVTPADETFQRTIAASNSVPSVVVFTGPMVLPDRLRFLHGAYAGGDIDSGSGALIRSLYGEQNVTLRQGTIVFRWVHSEKDLKVESDCAVYGRASAERSMHIEPSVEFERVHANPIVFENGNDSPQIMISNHTERTVVHLEASTMSDNCFSVNGDLNLPPRSLLRGNFVVRGSVRIGQGSRVEGSIKSYRDLWIEESVFIDGAIVSDGDLEVGSECWLRGPAVAGRRMTIRKGCQIGLANRPTSAIAPWIRVDPGVSIFGTIWARENGKVVA